jgi:hypothetical protein
MDQYMLVAWMWLQANPMTTFGVVYLALNLMPRFPAPKNPALFVLWDLFEKLMFLTRDSLPGSFKPLLENPKVK